MNATPNAKRTRLSIEQPGSFNHSQFLLMRLPKPRQFLQDVPVFEPVLFGFVEQR
jgi:hypothetical protein